MKFNKLIIGLFLVVFVIKTNAQMFKLGKVSVAELEEKAHPKDPSAVAAILFKKGEVRFEYSQGKGFEMVTVVQTRVKIYKKEGYEWANQAVQYYAGSNLKDGVSFSDAVTYNLVGGKIEKTKLKSDGEFDEKINKYWGRKKIAMPNVKEGSVIEYEYSLRTPRIGELKEWFFQSSIPVNYSEFTTHIPEYFVYNPNPKGYIFPKVTVDKSQKSIVINSKQRSGGGGFSSTTTTSFTQDKIDYTETKTTYLAENLPAMKEEAFVNNIDNYTASVSHELAMTKYPNSPSELYSTDWESVTKKIYDNEDFGAELNKTGYFEDDITTLIKGLTTQEEKISAIFNFVKTKVKWNDYYGYSCSEGVKKAYKEKIGNVAEINLMLTAMLRFAEIKANPVLISTRSNGIALFPSRTGFNYVIAAVEINDGLILLDATEKYSVPNILPLRDLNWFGRLIRKDGTSSEVDLMPKTLSRESTNMSIVLSNGGAINGKIRVQLANHEALSFRQKNIVTSKDNYLEALESKNNNIEISDYARENELDLSKPIVENYSFKDSKSVEMINGKIYISPILFLATKENPFKQEVREYPVDFGHPWQEKYNVSIEIPEGYVVESLPQSMNIATGEGVGAFKYSIANAGNMIQVSIATDINTPIVTPDFYEVIKDFFQRMIDKQNEKIVLKKA
jgi:transglutaminase-like putative cysteine protease